jgi:two-component system LytT family response regulator
MIRTIIVDDEQRSSDDLKGMLELYHNDIKTIAVCANIDEAEMAINDFKPELVFLDVELGTNQTSFDLLERLEQIDFEIIFTTAYNKYALQAIKASALDYLLKPVSEKELEIAIEKYKSKKSKVDVNKIESLLSAWTNPGSQQNRISLPSMTGYDLITVADIVSCEGISNQTSILLKNNTQFLISKTLKECEELLTPYGFFRIHKSYLINLTHVKKFIKGRDGIVVMSNEKSLPVSRHFKDQFVEQLRTPHSF